MENAENRGHFAIRTGRDYLREITLSDPEQICEIRN